MTVSDIVLVGDIHISARNDSSIMMNHQLNFFERTLFPYLEKNKIKDLLTFGDLFDRRKYTNHVILSAWKERFFNVLEEMDITFHTIVGNHDIPWANTLDSNTPSILLVEYSNVKIYDKPQTIKMGKTDVVVIPWMCSDNTQECLDEIKNTKAQICFGHFDISGFEMHKGHSSEYGLDRKIFDRFDLVLSGHFHTRSIDGNIMYLGTPYELTWADVGDRKGFYKFDCSTRDIEFVENPVSIFNKLVWDDENKGDDYHKTFDLNLIEDTFVKLVVANKTDPYQFDKFLNKLHSTSLAELKVIEDMTDYESDSVDDNVIELEDTMTLIDSYIDGLGSVEFDRDKMKKLMKGLYTEALTMEV